MNLQDLAKDIPIEGEYSLEGVDFITSGEQYLAFALANELYAVDILSVEEIRSWEAPTKIPNSPKDVIGVINMRGVIVPIIDLRIKFCIGEVSYKPTTVVIVLTVNADDRKRTMGFIVDAVSDVLDADKSDIKPAPIFGGGIDPCYMEGLLNVGNSLVTILNSQALQDIEKHT